MSLPTNKKNNSMQKIGRNFLPLSKRERGSLLFMVEKLLVIYKNKNLKFFKMMHEHFSIAFKY